MESDNRTLIELYRKYTKDGKTSMAGMSAMSKVFLTATVEERDEFLDFLKTEKELEA